MNEYFERARAALGDTALISIGAAILGLHILNWCRLHSRAGHNASLGILMAIPGLSLLMQTLYAWGRWPIEAELYDLRSVRRAVQKADATARRKAG